MATVDAQEELAKLCAVTNRMELADWFGISDKALRYVLYALPISERYKTFRISKRNGGSREIAAPIGRTRFLQEKLAPVLSAALSPHKIAVAYVPGRSLVDGAVPHRRKRWVATIDLENFFPSIHFGRVRGIFMARPFRLNATVATLLAQVCTKDGELPQGAATSPVLSNFACIAFDARLMRFAKEQKLSVSRYADDITFSSNTKDCSSTIVVSRGVHVASAALSSLVSSVGFRINPSKTRLAVAAERKMVTGLVVNKGINMPRGWRRQTRVMHNLLRKHGDVEGARIISGWDLKRPAKRVSLERVLEGRFNFVRSLEARYDSGFSAALGRAYWSTSPFLQSALRPIEMNVGVEGVTDKLYLEGALKILQARGMFRRIRPVFSSKDGDKNLFEWIHEVSRHVSDDVISVALFDCDSSDQAIKRICNAPDKTVRIGRVGQSVFAAALPPPRDGVDEYCIEHYFSDGVLSRRTALGRRLYKPDEFDSKTRIHKSERVFHPSSKRPLIVAEDVYSMDDGLSVALSKREFCDLVCGRTYPFEDVDLGIFAPVFELLERLAIRR